MKHNSSERRKEPRYPVEANVIVQKKNGERIRATAVDISSSGIRLRLGQPCPLDQDEEVTLEVELPEHPDKPFSSWGLGRVVYRNDGGIGIQLYGGHFDPMPAAGLED
jgi:c-di-GMP-binding flagellar brake protein YcgR